ncbi:MAG: polyisoprenoid-binding protein [Simkaniaceae bacterium]|nr:polyisoprenoid-binding protein [Simkaniaceae bacterium]
MGKWILEPGHTEAEFKVKHMMIAWVRGFFKDIHGEIIFDLNNPNKLSMKVEIAVKTLFTGESQRDEHLLSSDFLDIKKYPSILFESTKSEQTGAQTYKVTGKLTIKGITKDATIYTQYLGKWITPYDKTSVTRIGLSGHLIINRHDFNVSWNSKLENGGIVVGNEIFIQLDAEGLLEKELIK